ncbi:pseudaminic acid cytidylyltransferase [Tsuneonella suprasediminis]|uniref:Pseudaminic acid cytidylyltransferase n=1 Tax=Tsuneonella suprasediminis TaxID=2306996 RepID=A0A419QXY3_9SPHN|nr:pseudaminic acid cytidylyltransferase [Tsuneonella suprasediminis]RJX65557.1 pseudaminic acid cytidylyltransferase [Tsuneonella suprasediminis]
MRLAVIPARGGSKRIPRKNIRPFAGRPMISYSIAAAIESALFDRIIVSTDDAEIAEVARAYGAETPFVRSPELSDDYVGTIPVVADAIRWENEHHHPVDDVCCIYATAPFVQVADLRRGLDILHRTGAEFAFTITDYPAPIQRALRLNADDRLEMFEPEQFASRSQDLEEAWHDAGQFYWGKASAWLSGQPLFGPHAAPIKLPRYRVQDIDTPDDWQRAELLFKVQTL